MGHGDITKEYTAWCRGCAEWHTSGFVNTLRQAIAEIKGIGWKRIKTKWYCPLCVKERGLQTRDTVTNG